MFLGNRARALLTLVAMTMAIVGLTTGSASAEVILRVDFNSNQDNGGDSTTSDDPGLSEAAHNQEGWSSYHANHEVAAEFSTANYGGMTVTPAWPNTTDNRVQQSIDRGATNDNNWDDAAGDLDLVTDWIGIDTRTANGGNGNWDGTAGTPTYMTMTVGGLTAGRYGWTSFHHDTEHCHGPFAIWLSTDGGANFTQMADGLMTDSTVGGGQPDSGAEVSGPDVFTLSSTYSMTFDATGADVVLRFAPYSDAAGAHRQIWGMNGFQIERLITAKAAGPSPKQGAVDVPRDVDLEWTAGEGAVKHNVYLGTALDDVTNATVGNPLGVLVSEGQSQALYDVDGVLEFGQTYYWRVDEVAAAGTITAGDVWTFTVEPVAYLIESVVATSDLIAIEGQGPENTVNGSGLNENDEHSTDTGEMWTATMDPDGPETIQFEFDRVYKMHEMRVWNHNLNFESLLGLGLRDVTIEYSADGVDWTVLSDVELPQAPGQNTYTGSVVPLDGVPAKFIRLVINSAWLSTTQLGLSEVRFTFIPAYAREPQPEDGATNVEPDTILSWRAGREAVSHDVYLGTDPNALVLMGTTTQSSYDFGGLDLGTTYAWRVDEVNDADAVPVWASDVWTFSTKESQLIDGFEDYTDDWEAGETIWQAWLDGLTDDTKYGGSQVGYNASPFAEQTIVRSGGQSMPLKYNNLAAPFFSEAERTFASAQNWAQYGIKGLTLWFYGDPGNTASQMYVKINGQKVPYDGDTDSLLRKLWQMWYIDLAGVAGLDLANVRTLTIGFEGGTGTLFIDDITLSPAERQLVTPVEPGNAGLVGQWMFDEGSGTTAADSSGNNNHGTVQGNAQWVAAGKVGGALGFDGVDDIVIVTQNSGLPIYNNGTDNAYSVAMWVKGGGQNDKRVFSEGSSTNNTPLLNLGTHNSGSPTGQFAAYIRPDTGAGTTLNHPLSQTEPFDNTWHHIAWVDDNGTAVLYVDGQLDGGDFKYTRGTLTLDTTTIGGILRASPSHFFFGEIDEVCVYNRVLSQDEVAWLAGRTNPFDK